MDQDPINARFEESALSYIEAVPAVIAVCIFIGLLLHLLPRGLKRPEWARNIINEALDQPEDVDPSPGRTFSTSVIRLLVVSALGFLLQLFGLFHLDFRLGLITPAASWAAGFFIVAIWRPETTPKSLLVFHCSIFISQIILLSHSAIELRQDDIPALLGILLAFGSICIILNMPLRDPRLPHSEIGSSSGGFPTSLLRSPEDNLTLWQFMSVSWMAALIGLGSAKQLNDDDVWSLGYDFKHRMLTDKFRDLQGTVLVRLLKANGLDLMIMGVLAIIEVVASVSPLPPISLALTDPKI